MNRTKARRLLGRSKEPQTLRAILNQVERMAKCGFADVTILFPHEDKPKAIAVSNKLMDRGFVADIFSGARCAIAGKVELVVKWA